MALSDVRGNPVSSDEPASMAAYEQAQSLFHGYYGDPLGIIRELNGRASAHSRPDPDHKPERRMVRNAERIS